MHLIQDSGIRTELTVSQAEFNAYITVDQQNIDDIVGINAEPASGTASILGNITALRYKERAVELKALRYRLTNQLAWFANVN